MIITITIFFIAIIVAFGMLAFRAWEIRTLQIKIENTEPPVPEISFRHIEKNMLYLTKHIVQGAVLVVVKYWFIITTRGKKLIVNKWPKVNDYLKKKPESPEGEKPSFFKKAIIESKTKIRRIKEKVKREHGEEENKI